SPGYTDLPPDRQLEVRPMHALPWTQFRRRLILAGTTSLIAAALVAAGVWYFLPHPLPVASVIQRTPEAKGDHRGLHRSQIALIKSSMVVSEALKDQNIRAWNELVNASERIQKIQNELKVDFPYGTEYLRVSIAHTNGDEAKLLVEGVTKACLSEIEDAEKKERPVRLKKLEAVLEEYRKKLKKLDDEERERGPQG